MYVRPRKFSLTDIVGYQESHEDRDTVMRKKCLNDDRRLPGGVMHLSGGAISVWLW